VKAVLSFFVRAPQPSQVAAFGTPHQKAVALIAIHFVALPATAQVAAELQPNFDWVPPNDRAVIELDDGLSVITLSMPGNVAVLSGPDGILLVDNQMPPFDAQMVEDVRTITARDTDAVRFVINTHAHPDHLGSNAIWKARGATNVAHDNVHRSLNLDFDTNLGPMTQASVEDVQPMVTYSEEMRFRMNGQTVHVVHPAPAHTDGDSVVYFEEANVVHTGDIYLNKAFPVVDQTGSLDGLIAALEGIAARIDDDTRIIPGHGPVSNKAELENYTADIREMRATVAAMIEQGMTLEQVLAAKPFARFEEDYDLLTGMFGADLIAARVYQIISEDR
jgi:glyoxylase-like metal-dependent hydrolase (beta-lactamase superfamily II)